MLHGETIFMGFLVLIKVIKVNYVGMFHVMLVIKNRILGDVCDREDILDKKGWTISPPLFLCGLKIRSIRVRYVLKKNIIQLKWRTQARDM